GGEIAKRHLGVERVDADVDLLRGIACIQHFPRDLARGDLALRRDGILEIEDQRVGRGLLGAFEFPDAVAGDEQERSHRITPSVCRASTRCGGSLPPPRRAGWSWCARTRPAPARAATCSRAWR